MAGERRSGGLAVRSRNTHHWSFEEVTSQLDFADDFRATLACRLEREKIRWHTGREHDKVSAIEHCVRLRRKWYAQLLQPPARIRCQMQIGRAHLGSMLDQQLHRC
jgi:hypothetical protein